MRNDFKSAADASSYGFRYGRKAILNLLQNVKDDKIYILVDVPRTTPTRSATGATTGNTVVGRFMMLQKGDFDAMDDDSNNAEGVTKKGKYQKIIEPMKNTLLDAFLARLENCGQGWEITYNYIEVYNALDEVMDGLLINYTAVSYG